MGITKQHNLGLCNKANAFFLWIWYCNAEKFYFILLCLFYLQDKKLDNSWMPKLCFDSELMNNIVASKMRLLEIALA